MGNGAGVSRTAADESSWICKLPENVTRLKLRTILGILYDEGVFREHCRGNKDQNGDEFVARKVLQATCCGISHAEVFFANLVNFRTIRKSLDAAASGIPNFNDGLQHSIPTTLAAVPILRAQKTVSIPVNHHHIVWVIACML